MAKSAKELLEAAKIDLILRHPFFGMLVQKSEPTISTAVPTAGVTKTGKMLVNPAFIEQQGNADRGRLVFLLAHEAMHVVFAHLPRIHGRDSQVWNIATDAVINDLLCEEKVGTAIPGGVYMPGSKDRSADEIYLELMRKAQANKKQKQEKSDSGDGEGQGNGSGQNGSQGDDDNDDGLPRNAVGLGDLDPKEAEGMSEGERRAAEAQAKQSLAQAAHVAKMQGRMSGVLGDFVRQFIDAKLPWQELLERFMTSKSERHLSWNRPNKRYAGRVYLPRRERLPGMGPIIIGVDVSGSIGDHELNVFMSEVNRILEMARPTEVHVLYTTSEVEHVETFSREEYPVKLETSNRWYGGTHMPAIFEWAEENDIEPDACLIFTDMYTDFGEAPNYPVLWCATTEHTAPWGETIRVEVGDE